MKLTIELVPKSSWYSNVRSNVSKTEWDKLRREAYAKAGYVCEICGGCGPKWPVECHEVWHYDDENHLQRLDGLIALCPDCHRVKHIGLAGIHGKAREAEKHLAKVNGWSKSETRKYISDAFEIWEKRSQHEWQLDLSWLEKKGLFLEQKKGTA